jgi:hypothetical protein
MPRATSVGRQHHPPVGNDVRLTAASGRQHSAQLDLGEVTIDYPLSAAK